MVEEVGVEGDKLFALNARGAEVVEQESEDAGVGFDCKVEVSVLSKESSGSSGGEEVTKR